MADSFKSRNTLTVNGSDYTYYRLDKVAGSEKLPFSLKILLENLLRHEDGINVTKSDIVSLAKWDPKAEPDTEIAFTPARVLMQDFTGVPAVVDGRRRGSTGDPGEAAGAGVGLTDPWRRPCRFGLSAQGVVR